jgi:hypothetical protein
MPTTCNIFETIKTIRANSAPANKAWRTMREKSAKRTAAAKKAWTTRRAH